MTTLNLSDSDLIKVRSSWADLMAHHQHKENEFVNNAFAKLLKTNPELKPVFKDKVVYEQQKELFNELLKFTMTYLHDVAVLNECMDEFIKENPSLVKVGVDYLEPMGAVVIKTLRESLGREKFHFGLETLWIKVYIYIANCILVNDSSDVESVISNTNRSSASEEEILPLNVNKICPAPLAPAMKTEDAGASTIKIDLGGNEKYKGFRRSITESPKTPVLVKVPASFMTSPEAKVPAPLFTNRSNSSSPQLSETSLLASFDPRPLRRRPSLEEPMLTPRSSRRNSSVQLQELGLDSEVKETPLHPYDPRRKISHKRTPSDLSLNMEWPERLASTSSNDYQVSEVDDEFNLEDDQIDFSQTVSKPKNPVFDHNSFGIKGLAPIVESEHDDEQSEYSDNGSSHYAANSEKDSEDGYSSRTSSLSLHNLDYKSSISSGSGNSPVLEKAHKNTQSDVSFMAALPQASNPYPMLNRAFLSSVPSLCSRASSGQRASLGFMRSSFILKKEMHELGYNNPENVVMEHQLPAAARSMVNIPRSRSVSSFSIPTASPVTKTLPPRPIQVKSTVQTPTEEQDKTKKSRSSFRKKLSSIFGSSSSPAPTRNISGPISAPVPTPKASANASRPSMSLKSMAPSMGESLSRTSNRLSSMDLRMSGLKAPPSGYAASVYLKNTFDTGSIKSGHSGKSGFSFLKKNTPSVKYPEDGLDKKKNKYLVRKVPYKTIYVKDLIR